MNDTIELYNDGLMRKVAYIFNSSVQREVCGRKIQSITFSTEIKTDGKWEGDELHILDIKDFKKVLAHLNETDWEDQSPDNDKWLQRYYKNKIIGD